jgi:pilus assembly protein Flp/PilA
MLLLSTTVNFIRARFADLRVREDGVTAVEYALMVAIIALLLVGGFYALFTAVQSKYTDVGNCVATEPAPEDCSPGAGAPGAP